MAKLRIKAEKDLTELERFGFEKISVWGDEGYAYDFVPFTRVKNSYLVVHSASREVILDYVDSVDNVKLVYLMFDLIKSDLVEKVEEGE